MVEDDLLEGEWDDRGCCSGAEGKRRAFWVVPCGACEVLDEGDGAWHTETGKAGRVDRTVSRREEAFR